MKVPEYIRDAYRAGAIDYGLRYNNKTVSREIADHAEEYVARAPKPRALRSKRKGIESKS